MWVSSCCRIPRRRLIVLQKPTQPHALLFNAKSKLPLLWRVLSNTYKDKVALAVTRDKRMADVAQALGIDVSDGKAKVVVWGVGDDAATVYDGTYPSQRNESLKAKRLF